MKEVTSVVTQNGTLVPRQFVPLVLLVVSAALYVARLAEAAEPISAVPAASGGAAISVSAASAETNPPSAGPNNGTAPVVLGFDQLAGYPLPLTPELELITNGAARVDARINGMIPEKLRKLDGQRITVRGFMMPVAYEKDQLTEFILLRDMPGCCYGMPANPHEWVSAVVKAPKMEAEVDRPVLVTGIFHVGAQRQNGYLSGIYRLDAEKLTADSARP